MNDRDIDALVLKSFGLPADKYGGQPQWHQEYNRVVRDNSVLRTTASRMGKLRDDDQSAPAVLTRHLLMVAVDLADNLRRELEAKDRADRHATAAAKCKTQADAILEGIGALQREAA